MLKKSASTTEVAREARDMREKRDVDRMDSHLVSPVPPVSRVSHGCYPAWCTPVIRNVQISQIQACPQSISTAY